MEKIEPMTDPYDYHAAYRQNPEALQEDLDTLAEQRALGKLPYGWWAEMYAAALDVADEMLSEELDDL